MDFIMRGDVKCPYCGHTWNTSVIYSREVKRCEECNKYFMMKAEAKITGLKVEEKQT